MKMSNLLRTLRLFIPFIVLGLTLFIFFSLQCFLTALLIPLITIIQGRGHEDFSFISFLSIYFLVIGILVIIGTFLAYLLILEVYSRLLKMLWSSPPKALAYPKGFRDNAYHFLIALSANIVPVIIFNICLFFVSGFSTKQYMENLMYKSIGKIDGHNVYVIEALMDRLTIYGSMYGIFFLILSYFLYRFSDKFTKSKK